MNKYIWKKTLSLKKMSKATSYEKNVLRFINIFLNLVCDKLSIEQVGNHWDLKSLGCEV